MYAVLTSHCEALRHAAWKAVDIERMLLPVELEKEIGANEFLKEGVEVIDTEEEASEIRIMQLHLRDNLALMPKLS